MGAKEKMNKKLFGMLVCILFLSSISFHATGIVDSNNSYIIGGWTETTKLIASDGGTNDRFGSSVSIDGNDAIIGAYFDDVSSQINAGSAYVFVYSGSAWTQQARLTASDAATDDEFGTSVDICGDYAIVGSPYDDDSGTSSGSAYIFYRSGTAWTQQTKLIPADGAAGDKFGQSVSIDGNVVIVGAPGKSSNQGFSYTFTRSGSVWTQQAKLGAAGSTGLGFSVSISGDVVVMGAYGTNSNTGAAHIYEWYSSSWWGPYTLTASDGILYDLFGDSVSIDQDYIAVGAPGHDLGSGSEGATYIFEKPGSGWADMTETQKIIASDNEGGDGFGQSVSVDGEVIIVASPNEDGTGIARGASYIFDRGASSWSEVTKLTASDASNDDYFGWGVSISGNIAIVGAYAEDNTNGNEAGSAYIFEWTNEAPSPPEIDGKTSGEAGTSYEYSFTSTDPDGDEISYYIKWGDNEITDWTDFQASATEYTESHTWDDEGTYTIEAKAKDTYGAESEWSTLKIEMPVIKLYQKPILLFLENHPHLFLIIRYLLDI